MTPETNVLPFSAYDKLPKVSAVYEVWSQEECLYVGQTKNLYIRWVLGHQRAVECTLAGAIEFRWTPTDPENLIALELATITRLNPKFNNHGKPHSLGMIDPDLQVSLDALRVLRTINMPSDGYRLAFTVMTRTVPVSNLCYCSNAEYAKDLGIKDTARISKLLSILIRANLITRIHSKAVMVNPSWCFRGTPAQHADCQQTWCQLNPIGLVPPREDNGQTAA